MNIKLTAKQAYCSMIDYLEKYYFNTYANDIGDLLGGMLFLPSGKTADAAAWNDWIRAIDKMKQSQSIQNNTEDLLTITQSYESMINFLENYADLAQSEETRILLDQKMLIKNEQPLDQKNWNDWINSVEKILKQDPLILPPFVLLK